MESVLELMDEKIDYNTLKLLVDDKLIDPTPELVAEMFTSLGSDEQARFYNHIDKVASSWYLIGGSLSMQFQYITDEEGLSLGGRRVMQQIGDYSHWGILTHD